MKNRILLILFSILLLLNISCKQVVEEAVEKPVKYVGKKGAVMLEKVAKIVTEEASGIQILKQTDDDILKQISKELEYNPVLRDFITSNKSALNVYALMGKSPLRNNEVLIRYFANLMDELGETAFKNKYLIKESGDNLTISSKTGKELAEISDNAIKATPGNGFELNEFLRERNMAPDIPYYVNGQKYLNNKLGQCTEVSGTLVPPITNIPQRNIKEQGLSKKWKDGIVEMKNGLVEYVKAGYPRYKDEGGHLLANRFGGGSEMYNYIAMSKKLNGSGGGWNMMENKWAKALKEGKKVSYKIEPIYESSSKRPDKIYVTYEIDGERFTEIFDNNVF